MADGINTELVAIDFLAEIQADRKQQEAQWALESKRTEDFWNGLTAPDAAAERFDTGPGAVVLSVKRSRWECDDWLKVYNATIRTPTGRKIGSFEYRIVDTEMLQLYCDSNIHSQFFLSERVGDELECLGYELFTRGGGPDPHFYQGGSGVFGPELAVHPFALLCGEDNGEEFIVDEEFRRRGVGAQAIRELFAHKTLQGVKFIFVWPELTRFPHQLRKTAVGEKAFNIITHFFRKVGFRRVGTGPCMAYALNDPRHPSRQLAADEDTAIPYTPRKDLYC